MCGPGLGSVVVVPGNGLGCVVGPGTGLGTGSVVVVGAGTVETVNLETDHGEFNKQPLPKISGVTSNLN